MNSRSCSIACPPSSTRAKTATRLQVARQSASLISGRRISSLSEWASSPPESFSRSRISRGAVLCFMPIRTRRIVSQKIVPCLEKRLSRHQQGEQDDKGRNGPAGRRAPPPSGHQPLVEEKSVKAPRQERPDLFGVPLPVASPDDPRPQRPGPDPEGEAGKSPGQAEMIDPVKIAQRREEPAESARLLPSG